jgi:hypothetical protein
VLRHLHSASSTEWSPLWVFHVDRNRLLMLTKDASAPLALREVLHYPLTSASMLVRAGREALRSRSRPALRPHLLRARVLASYVRLLPTMVRRRRQFGRRRCAREGIWNAGWSESDESGHLRPLLALHGGR